MGLSLDQHHDAIDDQERPDHDEKDVREAPGEVDAQGKQDQEQACHEVHDVRPNPARATDQTQGRNDHQSDARGKVGDPHHRPGKDNQEDADHKICDTKEIGSVEEAEGPKAKDQSARDGHEDLQKQVRGIDASNDQQDAEDDHHNGIEDRGRGREGYLFN